MTKNVFVMSQDTAANKQNNMKFTSYLNTNYESLLNKGYRFTITRISDSDMHPNELGHELIARRYYEQYAKVYS